MDYSFVVDIIQEAFVLFQMRCFNKVEIIASALYNSVKNRILDKPSGFFFAFLHISPGFSRM